MATRPARSWLPETRWYGSGSRFTGAAARRALYTKLCTDSRHAQRQYSVFDYSSQCRPTADTTSTPSPSLRSRYCAPTTPTHLPRSPLFPSRRCRARSPSSITLARRPERQMMLLRESPRRRLVAILADPSRLRCPIPRQTRYTLALRPSTATSAYPR